MQEIVTIITCITVIIMVIIGLSDKVSVKIYQYIKNKSINVGTAWHSKILAAVKSTISRIV